MTAGNYRSSAPIVPFQPRSSWTVARIGILGIARRPALRCGSTTNNTLRALKSP